MPEVIRRKGFKSITISYGFRPWLACPVDFGPVERWNFMAGNKW
jgi:hypothetical protein